MKKFAVIGMGNFGFHVARALYEMGNDVVAIDMDKSRIQAVDPYCTEGVILDATERDRFSALGLDVMDCVIVCTGSKIATSILICLFLQEIGVKRIVARALDDDHAKILRRVGATEIIRPEQDMANRVARNLATPNVLDFIPLGEDFNLLQLEPPREFVGKSLRELNLRALYNVHIMGIKELVPERFLLVPPAEFVIKDSDILIIMGKTVDIQKIESLK